MPLQGGMRSPSYRKGAEDTQPVRCQAPDAIPEFILPLCTCPMAQLSLGACPPLVLQFTSTDEVAELAVRWAPEFCHLKIQLP